MTCLSTHHAAPSTQPFSLEGREPGKTPTGCQGPTLPGWWVRCGDRLEGQSHLQSHQTFPSGLERPQDYRHRRLVPHDPQPSPPGTHQQSTWALSQLFWVALRILLISGVQASRTCQGQPVRENPLPFLLGTFLLSTGLPHCPLYLCHRFARPVGSPAPLEEGG